MNPSIPACRGDLATPRSGLPEQAQGAFRDHWKAGPARSDAGLADRQQARRVLVVDDEPAIGRMLSMFLTRAGFSPVVVEGGFAALELLHSGISCDLLVTDQSMPGLAGSELVVEATRLRPGLPVLVMTGYDLMDSLGRLPASVPILRKPFGRMTFLDQVHALLGSAVAIRG